MQFDCRRISYNKGTAEIPDARIEGRLKRDLGADPGGVSGCNGDARQSHVVWLP
jgi:hypothetical protein